MRINPVVRVNNSRNLKITNSKHKVDTPTASPACNTLSFEGKHTYAKTFTGIAGTIGTLSAIGGSLIMTGGLSLPIIAGYGAICALSGTVVGAVLDSEPPKDDKKK